MDLIEISDNINRHPWEIARKNIVHKWISQRVQKESINILDVGSGDAYVADSFTKAFSSNVYCVDTGYTTDMMNTIKRNFDNQNLNLYSSLGTVKVNNFNIVTLLDVIEHVHNDVELLGQIISQPYINNDTYFIITVPAYQTLFSNHDELLKHYRRYNLKKLERVINDCNLISIDSGYFFSTLIISRILQLSTEKIMSKNKNLNNLGEWTGSKLITYVIKSILMIDYKVGRLFKLVGINIPGLSCYIICKKRDF